MKKSNKKGFTLVELVVVIAVLLILAAIAIPTVSGVIDKAHASTDAANAKAIETAIKYAIANNEVNVNTTNFTPSDTVGEALTLSGMSTDILTCKQHGYVFVYDATTDTVTVSNAQGAVAIASGTSIS